MIGHYLEKRALNLKWLFTIQKFMSMIADRTKEMDRISRERERERISREREKARKK